MEGWRADDAGDSRNVDLPSPFWGDFSQFHWAHKADTLYVYIYIYICILINISRLSRNYVLDDAMQGEWLMNGFILFPFPYIGTFWNLSYPESIRQLFSGRRIRAHNDILHTETMARRGNFIRSGPYFFRLFFTMNHPIFGGNDLSGSHDNSRHHGHNYQGTIWSWEYPYSLNGEPVGATRTY